MHENLNKFLIIYMTQETSSRIKNNMEDSKLPIQGDIHGACSFSVERINYRNCWAIIYFSIPPERFQTSN